MRVSIDVNVTKLARTGYEAYAAKTGGKTFDGRDMPSWTSLPENIKAAAWEAAAGAVADASVDDVCAVVQARLGREIISISFGAGR